MASNLALGMALPVSSTTPKVFFSILRRALLFHKPHPDRRRANSKQNRGQIVVPESAMEAVTCISSADLGEAIHLRH